MRSGLARSIFTRLLSLSVAATCLVTFGRSPSQAETIELWNRPGGYTHLHIKQADAWLARGAKLVIRDWQVSAAAIQVLYFKRHGGRVCFAKSGFNAEPALFFHTPTSRGQPQESLSHYVGAANAGKIGSLSQYRFKRFHPSAFGIRACAGKTKADQKITKSPALMRW